MAQLMVRKVTDELVKALKQRAAKHNRSAEQEHREILQSALRGPAGGRWPMYWLPCPMLAATRTSFGSNQIPEADCVSSRYRCN